MATLAPFSLLLTATLALRGDSGTRKICALFWVARLGEGVGVADDLIVRSVVSIEGRVVATLAVETDRAESTRGGAGRASPPPRD